MNTPSFQEDHISQIPALQLLQNLGYAYLRPQEVHLERRGKYGNVLLERILERQLRKINRITFRGADYAFSDANIQAAIEALKDIPFDGLVRTNEQMYDLLTLGKSLEQNIDGQKKSFSLRYIDWDAPENNVFHVAEEFEVERSGSHETRRPDVILFVNGIPLVVIECKRPDTKGTLEQAISQQIRNQSLEEIPGLFIYAQLLLAITKNEASYGTVGSAAKFWAHWNERKDVSAELRPLINRPLPREQHDRLFLDRYAYVKDYFEELAQAPREPSEQDKALYCLCRPERLLELAYRFIVFDAGEKKIARYQQYFAVKRTMTRVVEKGDDGRRKGGVIWHTQGSGKSLTMVMLGKALALEKRITDPRIVLVTDRVDLDDQIWKTFHQCGKDPVQAKTGKHLLDLLEENKASVITTIIDKFEAATKRQNYQNQADNIFVLVDESHRSQYGPTNTQMQKVLPFACYIGFTGTPLMRREKNTAERFGGMIDVYPIDQAVRDKAVVPLLYEGRHILQEVDRKAVDKWFVVVSEPLTEYQRTDLKKKFASADELNKLDSKVKQVAFDVSEHFRRNWQGTPFKAQLTAPSKAVALKYKEYLDEFGHVSSEVLISGPDSRDDNEDIYQVGKEAVQAFWKRTIEKFGSEANYNKQLINSFKNDEKPEIIIVVDKLLTGFDAPRNTVLYITRSLKEHTLLQAIARVNRLHEGKDFGYVIDYYGVIEELNDAMQLYSSFSEYDEKDLEGTLTDVAEEVAKLPQRHSELWDVFKEIKNKLDEEAYELHLADDERRERFYEMLSNYSRTLGIALSTLRFVSTTPVAKVERYKKDLLFFQKLRSSVKRRYAEEIDYKEYEAKVQKLLHAHVSAEEVIQVVEPVNIFEQEKFQEELEKVTGTRAKADTIVHRTKRTITEKIDEDPFFYRKFSRILEDVIEQYRAKRFSDAEYLKKVTEVMEAVRDRKGDTLPEALTGNDVAKAFYGVVYNGGLDLGAGVKPEKAAEIALKIDEIILSRSTVSWQYNSDIQNRMRDGMDDYLFDLRDRGEISLTTERIDQIIEESLTIARMRYAR
jgi:type I restriction enzyme R subunit